VAPKAFNTRALPHRLGSGIDIGPFPCPQRWEKWEKFAISFQKMRDDRLSITDGCSLNGIALYDHFVCPLEESRWLTVILAHLLAIRFRRLSAFFLRK